MKERYGKKKKKKGTCERMRERQKKYWNRGTKRQARTQTKTRKIEARVRGDSRLTKGKEKWIR